MNEEVIKILKEDWIYEEDHKYLSEALRRINNESTGFDITKPDRDKVWEYVFEDDMTQSTIDYMIERLQKLKDNGFEFVGYDDWQDNLIAYYYLPETTRQCAARIESRINSTINVIKNDKELRHAKVAELDKLKKEVARLEKELYDTEI